MAITVRIQNVYGKQAIYPVCRRAQLFAELAGTTTLTPAAVAAIKALGFAVNVEQQPVTL